MNEYSRIRVGIRQRCTMRVFSLYYPEDCATKRNCVSTSTNTNTRIYRHYFIYVKYHKLCFK